MKIAVLKEQRDHENRVAAVPDTVKKMVKMGLTVAVEKGAGLNSNISDSHYQDAGAVIAENLTDLLSDADVILKVQRPTIGKKDLRNEISPIKTGSTIIGLLSPYSETEEFSQYAEKNISSFALEFLPRITRAQTMDALSSQSNLAGYRAVIDAANVYGRAFPMMMTAAGTIRPAHVLVLGAGVAGLQSIATARRLGAVVTASDVRVDALEEAKSLGASVIEVEVEGIRSSQTSEGYAKEMNEDFKRRQAEKITEAISKQDIVICTALIPGRPAPVLVNEPMLEKMKRGSVVVDLSVSQGGNCFGSKDGEVVELHGVKIIGFSNFPSRIAADASELYARNVLNFLTPLYDSESGKLKIDLEDEIIKATLLTQNGKVVHPTLKAKEQPLAASKSA